MPDLEVHLEGETADKAAAEIGAVLEYDFDTAGHGGIAPGPVLREHQRRGRSTTGAASIVTMTIGIPSDTLADADLSNKVHLLEQIRRIIDIAKRHRDEHGTTSRLELAGASRDLTGVEPDEIIDAARHEG